MRLYASIGFVVFSAIACAASSDAIHFSQPEIPLWPNLKQGPPEKWMPSTDGIHRVTDVHNPSITVFLPPKDKANGAAFVIAPGGGHSHLTMDLEGSDVAKTLNAMGIAGFVLKSRLAHTEGYHYTVEGESLQDAQQAMRLVRSRAKEWNVDPSRLGMMGFSAGGELTALVETRSDADARPNFAVLGYPGLKPGEAVPTKDTPPTFIVVADDDKLSLASAQFYLDLKKAGVPVEMHIYNQAGHGFGTRGRTEAFHQLPTYTWPSRLEDWLKDRGYIPK